MRIRNGLVAAAVIAFGTAIGSIVPAQSTTNPSGSKTGTFGSTNTNNATNANSADQSAGTQPAGTALPLPPPVPNVPVVIPTTTIPSIVPPPTATIPNPQPSTELSPTFTTAPASATTGPDGTQAIAQSLLNQAFSTTLPTTQIGVTTPENPSGHLGNVLVTSDLDETRDQIAPPLGAVTYTIGPDQIQAIPEGENATFQQVLLRAPGVVEDSFGQEHVRGEHANLTYRINGVLLPQPINAFGQEIDTHLIDTVTLIDGSLPAQFGFHTAGIVDIVTKTGGELNGGEVSFYGGSYDTFEPSVEYGGTSGKWDYFISADYKHNDDGIENPTPSKEPIHDDTSQEKEFAYASYRIDDTSRVTLMLNGSNADFQIPNTPDQPQLFNLAGVPSANSADINENQNEQAYYGVVSYLKTSGNFSMQASGFSRYGEINFTPDPVGDLIFQGVAGAVLNRYVNNGGQFDSSYILNDQHTLRAGFIADDTQETANTTNSVFPVDPVIGLQTSDVPETIVDNTHNQALESGLYLQDEWHLTPKLTFNYGLRYDRFDANFDHEDQVGPRANLVDKIDDATTIHIGYARYFVPPPVQYVPPSTIAKFVNTTNAPANFIDDPPQVERSNYFDAGISHQLNKGWQVTLDGFYKHAHNLVDLGQFGDAVIESPFNYSVGTVYGAELSSTYKQGPWSAFGNFSYVETHARDIDSQQFLIDNAELAFIQNTDIHLDHEGELTLSLGTSYDITKDDEVSIDALYGSGLRSGFANTQTEPQYFPVNLGYQHTFHVNDSGKDLVKLRFDIINVFDESYQLRSGTGIGVNAPQYGQRRTFLAGLSYEF